MNGDFTAPVLVLPAPREAVSEMTDPVPAAGPTPPAHAQPVPRAGSVSPSEPAGDLPVVGSFYSGE